MRHYREIGHAILRATLGVMFFFYGVGKFQGGIGNFAAGMEKQFAGKLPGPLVTPFAYTLPFAEVAIGTLLIFGLLTEVALILAGLLMIALTFGTVMQPSPPTVANNVSFALVIFVLLWTAEYNRYSIGGLRRPERTGGSNSR